MDESEVEQSFAEYIDGVIGKHATQVGRVVIAWNSLQNVYAKAFALVATPNNHSLGYALLNSIKSDKGQRDMLAAAVKHQFQDTDRARIELEWAIEATNKTLTSSRNTTVHAPYTFILDEGAVRVIPNDDTDNTLAKKLLPKDLEKECATFIEEATFLRVFIRLLMGHLRRDRWADPNQPWPERPILLSASPQKPSQSQTQLKNRKERQPREKPSRG